MAPPGKPDLSGFQYSAMSSLVLMADKSQLPRRDQEPTGEPETLVGRIDPKAMGSRAGRESADTQKKKQRANEDREKRERRERRLEEESRAAKKRKGSSLRYGDVLEAAQDLEGYVYIPRTSETREYWDHILSLTQSLLGDVPHEMVRSAAGLILEILKNDQQKDLDKHRQISEVFSGPVSTENFTTYLQLSKKITDYGADDDADAKDPDDERRDGEIDDEQGVAVQFAGEDEESEDEGEFEIRDESDEDEEEEAEKDEGDQPMADVEVESEEELIIGGSQAAGASKGRSDDIVSAGEIHAFWLQAEIGKSYTDPIEAVTKTDAVLDILSSTRGARDAENELMELTDYDKFDLVKKLMKNREKIVWCTMLAKANDDEKVNMEVAMREKGLGWILKELSGDRDTAKASKTNIAMDLQPMDVDQDTAKGIKKAKTITSADDIVPRKAVDLDSMAFSQGARLMSNKKVKLPEGSFKRSKKGYEEVHVPAPQQAKVEATDLVKVEDLPVWIQPPFQRRGEKSLNRIQSKVYPIAFGTDEPMLLCAPTGAGKTNCAMLTMLNEISKHRNETTGEIDVDAFKMVYIAPMKALVQEQVANFAKRLEPFGITVRELTGDRQLTKQQISETQLIVTTPEKWDVITRKSTDTSYTNLVRLIIVDEIHLLHDERGPVLESIVARTIRRMEQTQDYVRLVGLSATLPNYRDVASFLQVDPKKGLFFFDASYRPIPLKMQFVGVTEKRAIARYQTMNEVCYEKVAEGAGKFQVLVFVHSRKETAKTAKFLMEKATVDGKLPSFLKSKATELIIKQELEDAEHPIKDPSLRELLPMGFAIHHAGLVQTDRSTVEDLFAAGHIQVLVCTATLAWGVNLPAHTVIIKGTQVYNPEKGRWVELSPQDTHQILGRAGRPGLETEGEGIIITNHSELQYFLSMMNQQLPIESQLVAKLADALNPELVLGTIRSRAEAVDWLGYTYLFRRMLGNPVLYSIPADYQDEDPQLRQKRADIVHTAAVKLEKSALVKYDRKTGTLQSTELGRIAAHYYITHTSMATYNKHLRPGVGQIELFRIFALSDEFKYIPVREEEKMELSKLLDRVPIPIKESVEDPAAKINALLQSYISRLKLDGFALVADMVYVTQSAGRLLRALFEICLKRGWAALTHRALELCKMVEKRMWSLATPLRQFPNVPADVIRKVEGLHYPWSRYYDLDPPAIGELIGIQRAGPLVHRLIHQFPKVDVQASLQPVTRSTLRIELTITPDFQWNPNVHGGAETFWILVEDVDGEILLYHDQVVIRERYKEDDHTVTFTVPMLEPTPPNYFVSVVSDRWMHSETRLPISFKNFILPEKFPPPTPLLDLQPLPVQALHNKEFEKIYSDVTSFNKIQTQVFQALYTANDNVLVAAPTGSGKTICAEFALLRLWSQPKAARAVCIEPFQDVVDARVREWTKKFGHVQGGKTILALTNEPTANVGLLERADIVICTPSQWDMLTRHWKKRKAVQTVGLIIADEIQMIGGHKGSTYEIAISRSRFIAYQTRNDTRFVALGVSLANARDLGEWLGASQQTIYNFSPSARPLPMEIHLQSFNVPHFPSLMIQMARPAYLAIVEWASDKPVIAFVPSRKQCRLTAQDLLVYCSADDENRFLNVDPEELAPHLEKISDSDLKESLAHGIGFYHEALSVQDKRIVERLYELGAIQVVVASKDTAWSIPLTAYMVIIMGREHRYVDYPFTDVLQMMGRACRPSHDASSKCVLMCQQTRKDFLKKFLGEGLPIESHVQYGTVLADYFNAAITTRDIENNQGAVDLCTWLYMYRRLTANPNYYGMTVPRGTKTFQALSDHLSDLVETTLSRLQESDCITVEDDTISPNNPGMIAAYYDIQHDTIDTFNLSLNEKTKLRGLLEIVTFASEFDEVPIRHHEDVLLQRIYNRVPIKVADVNFDSPHHKANILLQAHFSRFTLPADLAADLEVILGKVINLLYACVDVMTSHGFLNALNAMELCQMCVQAMWVPTDSALKQIPHFSAEVIGRSQDAGIQSVYDIGDMEDEDRNKMLQMDTRQMVDVANFVNAYPSIDITHEVQTEEEEMFANGDIFVKVTLERDVDEDDDAPTGEVVAPFFPGRKSEMWWIVIGEPSTKQLLFIKKVTVQKRTASTIKFSVPTAGKHDLQIYLMSDSYVDADKVTDFSITVKEGEDEDEEDEEDEDEEMGES